MVIGKKKEKNEEPLVLISPRYNQRTFVRNVIPLMVLLFVVPVKAKKLVSMKPGGEGSRLIQLAGNLVSNRVSDVAKLDKTMFEQTF